MKIIAILDNAIGTGGGFDQALNAILQMQRLSKDRFKFEVFTTQQPNIEFLTQLGLQATYFKYSLFDHLLAKIAQNSWWQSLQSRIKLIGPLERRLALHNCDLVYFCTPGSISAALQKLNYMATVWDLSHRDSPEFPEVRNFNTFFVREKHYKNNLAPAVIVLTDSEQLADLANQRYGIDRDRFLPIPFGPAPFLEQQYANDKIVVLNKYNLGEGYFFYPAQFWAHKNHIRILQALLKLRQKHNWKPMVVFSGKDYGNLDHIQAFMKNNQLESQVKILGFVPSEDMRGLYAGSLAVVMPTYFGPTNLPPLEAWSLGKPLIYSSHLSAQVGAAALLVNPDDANSLAQAMLDCTDTDTCQQLITAGAARLLAIDKQRTAAEERLCKFIEIFATRRECWH